MTQTYLTKQGLKELQTEYDLLITQGRVESAEKIKAAIDSGGYEDNVNYDLELEKQHLLEKRISELEDILRDSKIIETKKNGKDVNSVVIGSFVIVEVEGEKDQFRIVGSIEANPIKKLISNESPVGQALLGAKPGDTVEVNTPVVKLQYKVVDIKND